MPAKKVKTVDLKKYHREYQRIYYRKNIVEERKKSLEYYHKNKHKKGFMKPLKRKNTCKVDEPINTLKKKEGKFFISFD